MILVVSTTRILLFTFLIARACVGWCPTSLILGGLISKCMLIWEDI